MPDPDDGLMNLPRMTEAVLSFGPVINIVAVVIGLLLIAGSLVWMARLKRQQPGGNNVMAGVFTMMLVGGLFLSLPALLDAFGNTVFENNLRTETLELLEGGGDELRGAPESFTDQAVLFGIAVIAVVGLIGFIRGWLLINAISRSGTGQGRSYGHAIVLIVGGILAINLPVTLRVLAATIGGTVGNTIEGFIPF